MRLTAWAKARLVHWAREALNINQPGVGEGPLETVLQARWRAIQLGTLILEQTSNGANFVFVTSRSDLGLRAEDRYVGLRTFEVPIPLAAQLLADATHRLSSPEEIAGWKAKQGQGAAR